MDAHISELRVAMDDSWLSDESWWLFRGFISELLCFPSCLGICVPGRSSNIGRQASQLLMIWELAWASVTLVLMLPMVPMWSVSLFDQNEKSSLSWQVFLTSLCQTIPWSLGCCNGLKMHWDHWHPCLVLSPHLLQPTGYLLPWPLSSPSLDFLCA